jgi:hypothetical protein
MHLTILAISTFQFGTRYIQIYTAIRAVQNEQVRTQTVDLMHSIGGSEPMQNDQTYFFSNICF